MSTVKKPFTGRGMFVALWRGCVSVCVCKIMERKINVEKNTKGNRFYRKRISKERKNSESNQVRQREGALDGLKQFAL